MLNQHSALTVFRCPACSEYIASDSQSCRFCHLRIEPEVARSASRRQTIANQSFRRKNYRTHLIRGAGLFLAGIAIMVLSAYLSWTLADTDFVWIPRALVFGGGGDFIYGIYGLLCELRTD